MDSPIAISGTHGHRASSLLRVRAIHGHARLSILSFLFFFSFFFFFLSTLVPSRSNYSIPLSFSPLSPIPPPFSPSRFIVERRANRFGVDQEVDCADSPAENHSSNSRLFDRASSFFLIPSPRLLSGLLCWLLLLSTVNGRRIRLTNSLFESSTRATISKESISIGYDIPLSQSRNERLEINIIARYDRIRNYIFSLFSQIGLGL